MAAIPWEELAKKEREEILAKVIEKEITAFATYTRAAIRRIRKQRSTDYF